MPVGSLLVNLTGYCPFKAGLSPRQQGIEGGPTDARDKPLITYEQHKSDPDAYPYVSCSGDLTIWRYGQRIEIPSIDPDAVFRVVDTGASFHGPPWYASSGEPEPTTTRSHPRKKIRVDGHEPIDVCVNDCDNHPGGFGAREANVPDDGLGASVANLASDAFQAVGIPDVDLTGVAFALLGLAVGGLAYAMGG